MKQNMAILLICVWALVMAACSPAGSSAVQSPIPDPTLTATVGGDASASGSALGVAATIPEALLVNQNCVVCHDLHPVSIVEMPHEPHPSCNACHNGSPVRIGCPSCHSMHQVEMEHDSAPDILCQSCHLDMVPPTVVP